MVSNLQQVLRRLCLNTGWKYAIFWKLEHSTRRILTWEDAYYDNPDYYDDSENKCCHKNLEQICGRHFSCDPLGLAMATMSHHVYSLGEGIVGWVAVTGKHKWICVDNQLTGSGLSFEFADRWQSQFSAGIRTIVVVPVVPLGVVQLGSINKVIEDTGVVTLIRNLFLTTQAYSIDHVPSQIQSCVKNSPSLKMAVDGTEHGGPEPYSDENSLCLHSISNTMIEHRNSTETRTLNGNKCKGSGISCKGMRVELDKRDVTSLVHNPVVNKHFNDSVLPSGEVGVGSLYFPTDILEAVTSESDKLRYVELNQQGGLKVSGTPDANYQKITKKLKLQTKPCYRDNSYLSLDFPSECELHEALGPAFVKRNNSCDLEAQVNQNVKNVDMPVEISCSQLSSESCPEHLLEAIVANVCHCNNDDVNSISELSFCTSMQSSLASGKNPETSLHTLHTICSEAYSLDQPSLARENKHSFSSSEICGVMSPKGFSSTCPSVFSKWFRRSCKLSKDNKKRTRPGEGCRPRPRDRQLIQDRIKELRELVPNGAKGSIDSLLERTIEHMLFLQSKTKHADKLNKFSDPNTKLHHVGTDDFGSSSYEQGFSWAMEVGGHLTVPSILVESLGKNGQMLVEMLCEECNHFLEISETIRCLGLTILNGATEDRGNKTWMCFVVEGQNNRRLHRLDILWPLVQILQSKSTMYLQHPVVLRNC